MKTTLNLRKNHLTKGIMLAKFAAHIGVKDSNIAEILAIVFAVELSLEKEWLREGNVIIESDSVNGITW